MNAIPMLARCMVRQVKESPITAGEIELMSDASADDLPRHDPEECGKRRIEGRRTVNLLLWNGRAHWPVLSFK
jgi:hypothetical protein